MNKGKFLGVCSLEELVAWLCHSLRVRDIRKVGVCRKHEIDLLDTCIVP